MPHPASMSCYIGGGMSEETARATRMKKNPKNEERIMKKELKKNFSQLRARIRN